jgi:hypothetical protein
VNSARAALFVASCTLAWLGPCGPAPLAQVPATPPAAAPVASPSLVRPPVTIKCPGGNHYRLSTGSSAGACKLYQERGRILGGLCTDGANSARQTCASGCLEITGAGVCDKDDPHDAVQPEDADG